MRDQQAHGITKTHWFCLALPLFFFAVFSSSISSGDSMLFSTLTYRASTHASPWRSRTWSVRAAMSRSICEGSGVILGYRSKHVATSTCQDLPVQE
jgi:hypothetical protein